MAAAAAGPASSACGNERARCETCDIRRLAICRAVDLDRLARLAKVASCRRVEAGMTLFDEGEAAEDVFTVTQGMLKLYKLLSDGRRQVVGFLLPGDFLGLAFGRTYMYSAEAVTPVTLCRFRREPFLELLQELPSLKLEILTRTSTDLAAAQEQMLLLGRKTARERVASFFLNLADRCNAAEGGPIQLPMGRADIADYLGLTIETVSRTLTSLRKEGVIDLPAIHELVIRHPAELERIAGQ